LISAIGKSFLRGAKLADFSEYQRSSRILFSRFRSSMFLSGETSIMLLITSPVWQV
jgi:isopentenyl diphosphate isomerase/L-lactate dehydrogenase-like FMN-dependent dehydrogenase